MYDIIFLLLSRVVVFPLNGWQSNLYWMVSLQLKVTCKSNLLYSEMLGNRGIVEMMLFCHPESIAVLKKAPSIIQYGCLGKGVGLG